VHLTYSFSSLTHFQLRAKKEALLRMQAEIEACERDLIERRKEEEENKKKKKRKHRDKTPSPE